MKVFKLVVIISLCSGLLILFCGAFKESKNHFNNNNKNSIVTNVSVSPTAVEVNGSIKTDKVLIVYFSLTGNTGKVADMIQASTKGEVFELEPDFDYSSVSSRSEMERLGKEQVDSNFQPELKNSVADFESYDLVIIGSPVWWFSVSPPVMSFLSQYDFEGKKVAPFCTCGSAEGDFFAQIEGAVPDAEVLNGLVITEPELGDEQKLSERITAWLEEIDQ